MLFIGASGCGKCTLLNLIGGFLQPQALDMSCCGTKISHMTQTAWQDVLSYISQDPYLLLDTMLANIWFYRPELLDVAGWELAESAGLTTWMYLCCDG